MSDDTYQTAKVYHRQGGDELVVKAGGTITVESGGALALAAGASLTTGGSQAAAIADPTGGSTADDESRAAIIDILTVLRGAGLIAAS